MQTQSVSYAVFPSVFARFNKLGKWETGTLTTYTEMMGDSRLGNSAMESHSMKTRDKTVTVLYLVFKNITN